MPDMRACDYPWLVINADGGYEATMSGTTPAEMDRRMVIMQEIRAGRLALVNGVENVPATTGKDPS